MDNAEYEQALERLYEQAPAFHKLGAHAYKPGLERVEAFDALLGHPHRRYRTIHVAGTNGKGSTAHTLAAILQSAGLRTGLFTSPHLVDFRERIRVDGEMISREGVMDFLRRLESLSEGHGLESSFFEITTMMALDWFARSEVDVAVIEVGLGGRLDSTNIIRPELCVVTSISMDHTEQLGDTLAEIAAEKAGIIKAGIAHGVVVSGCDDASVAAVMRAAAERAGVALTFATVDGEFTEVRPVAGGMEYESRTYGPLRSDLGGLYQPANMAGVVKACELLDIDGAAVRRGMADVTGLTGLMGRWTVVGDRPLTVVDTGHNIGGWEQLARQIAAVPGEHRLVVGFVADKHLEPVFGALLTIPNLICYFAAASTPRALAAGELCRRAREAGILGDAYDSPEAAYEAAVADAHGSGLVFVGGSNFLVGDLLPRLRG